MIKVQIFKETFPLELERITNYFLGCFADKNYTLIDIKFSVSEIEYCALVIYEDNEGV